MGGSDRGCCDKCAKIFIMAINIVIIIIGGAILAAGIYWQLSPTGFYKEIFNHDIFNIPIISIVIGSLLLLVGLAGFFGSCCEVVILLKVYMGFLIIILLVEVILAVGCVAAKSTVQEYAANRTRILMGYYGDSTNDEEGIIKLTIDEIQENFECCGVSGAYEWADATLVDSFWWTSDAGNGTTSGSPNNYLPNSCCTAAQRLAEPDTCGEQSYVDHSAKFNTGGCKSALTSYVSENLLYVGIATGAIVLLQLGTVIMIFHTLAVLQDEHVYHDQY